MVGTIESARARYPALMAYIESRSEIRPWYDALLADKAAAEAGEFADVVADMARAEADYGAYPYNEAMGRFLGLPIREGNREPPHGYYMARCVVSHHKLGVARQEAQRLIADGRELRVIAAKSKATGKGIRFHRFRGAEQIVIEGDSVRIVNGKVKGRLAGNWSTETVMEHLAAALRTGTAYGEA